MSKPTLYRNRLIPLESILLTNDEILYHDDKKIITFWKTLHPKSDLAYGYSCYFLDRGFKISRFYSHSHDFMYWYCDDSQMFLCQLAFQAQTGTHICSYMHLITKSSLMS